MGALEHNDMRAFVSEPFSDVMEVRARLKQCILLDEADVLERSSRQLVVFFWEHRFQVVASVFKGLGYSDMLLDKRVVAMARYDREHGTELMDTLFIYLQNACNTQRSARMLSLHKNTLLYRLGRIREILGCDLSSGEDQFMLQLSYRVLFYLDLFKSRLNISRKDFRAEED